MPEQLGKLLGHTQVQTTARYAHLARDSIQTAAARAVARPVDVRAYADRIVIRQDGETVAEYPRSFGRGEIAYDPWHYVPILTRKPGALRNGAPFKGWQLPGALGRIRARLTGCDDGDRQFVRILAAVQEDGLEAVEARSNWIKIREADQCRLNG